MPTMAPDQRAALELVLRQGRSYGELAELLGMPEETIRTRARGGVIALAPPGLDEPTGAGEIADWLLGQRERAQLGDPDARAWAAAVASALRMLPGGERVPEVPEPKPLRHANGTARAPEGDEAGSSRLGGALLIGAAVVLVVAVLVFVLTRDGEDDPVASAPSATATATPTPQSLGYVMLKGPAGATSVGAMQVLRFTDDTIRFALAAQGVEPNQEGQRYSLWLTKKDGSAQILGDVQQPVGKDGELASAGPGNADVDKFPEWFQSYDAIVVTLDEPNSKHPGKVILKGDLPHSQQG
jgi:hypothetical protein